MEVADSERKHGILNKDIEHAMRNPLRVIAGEGEIWSSARIAPADVCRSSSSTMTRTKSRW